MRKISRSYQRVALVMLASACLAAFQNCSGFKSVPSALTSSSNSSSSDSGAGGVGGVVPNPTPTPTPTSTSGQNASQAAACTSMTVMPKTMAIQSPCSTNVVTANQKTNPTPIAIGITDKNAQLVAASLPIQISAPGMVNVEVYTHGKMQARLNQAGTSGVFTGSIDLSAEPAGPLHISFNAWDAAAGDNSYTTQLSGVLTVFVAGTRLGIPSAPLGAQGLTLKWSDRFSKLSSAACNPNTGVWPNCTIATASGSGATWYENTPGGYDYGDAAFEHSDGKYNPFAILSTGMLRIRATYDTNYVDPYGYKRKWYGGMLATAFGRSLPYTTNIPLMTDGYYEARLLAPNAACANTACSGGTWPAFWQLTFNQTAATGSVEVDSTELYGNDPYYQQSGVISYAPAKNQDGSTGGVFIYNAHPGPDLTQDFHRFGMRIQGSGTNAGTVCNYMDDVLLGCKPMPVLANGQAPQWYFLVNLAMGSGWPTTPPPSNEYDMFVDYVAAWTK